MWQLYALGSLFGSAGEYITDKIAIVNDRRIDSLVATFWRLLLFFAFTLLIGLFGWLGAVDISFNWVILFVAATGVLNSLAYTYLLRKIEVTGIGAITYLSPFLFLLIDEQFLHTTLSGGEVAGIFLMVLGGFSFAIDGKTHHFKREYSPTVWLMLLWMVAYTGIESYAFKYLHAVNGTTAVGFDLSYSVLMVGILFVMVVLNGKAQLLWTKPAKSYLPAVTVSKAFDATASVLWVQALTLAAVSQVSAMEALEPLLLFVLTVLVQDVLRIRTDEKTGRSRMRWKAVAIAMLVFGGLLVN